MFLAALPLRHGDTEITQLFLFLLALSLCGSYWRVMAALGMGCYYVRWDKTQAVQEW